MNKTETIQLVRYGIPPPFSFWWNTDSFCCHNCNHWRLVLYYFGLPLDFQWNLRICTSIRIRKSKVSNKTSCWTGLLWRSFYRRIVIGESEPFLVTATPACPDKEANEGVSWGEEEEEVVGGSRRNLRFQLRLVFPTISLQGLWPDHLWIRKFDITNRLLACQSTSLFSVITISY